MTTTSYNIYQQITSVRVATTANLSSNYFNGSLNNGVGATLTALSVGALTIDGVLLEVGDRILVKNQSSTNQNGLYVVQSVGSFAGLWMIERAPDFQSVEQLKVGQYFSVGAGFTLAGSMFILVEPLPSVIGMGTFDFVSVADTVTPAGPFLLKAANLSDLANRETGFTNLGLGSGDFLIIDESDFVAGLYTLTNPCPNLILVNATTPGNAVRLPPVDQPESFIPSQGPVFFIDQGFEGIDVQDSSGAVISPLAAPACEQFILTSNAFPQGVWFVRSFASTVNGKSGDVVLTSSLQTIYVSNSGSDALGADGSVLNPYATLSHALASITPSSSNPYEIIMSTGVYTEANLVLKPWVVIKGEQSQLTVSVSVTLDASWSTGGYLYFSSFFNLSWPATVTFDFDALGSPFSLLNFSYNIFSSNTTLNVIGQAANGSIVLINNNFGFSGQFIYNITDCYGAIQGGASGDINIINNSETAGGNFTVVGMTEIGNFTAITSSNAGITLFHEASKVIGDTVYQSTGAGTLIAIEKGVTHVGTLTLDNGSGGGLVNFSANTLTALPLLLNGATYTPDSISDAMNANVNFTPVNYTPVSGGPGLWVAASVTGNLAGIDAALSGMSVGVYQQLYINDAAGNDSNSGSIASPMKTYEAARLKAVSLGASFSNPFVIVPVGVFSIVGNMTITPYVSVIGTSDFSTRISVSGSVVLDPLWDSTPNPFSIVRNINFAGAGNINLVYTVFQPDSFLRFQDCSIQISPVTIVGSGTNPSCETIVFNNCNTDSNNEPVFDATDVNFYLFDTNPSNDITVSVLSLVTTSTFCLTAVQTRTGNITLNATSTGTLISYIAASNTLQKTLTINGASNTVHVDSSSYQFTLSLMGGATLANLVIPSKTDGLSNTSYTPVNYTPVSDPALYQADSLTGNLRGIDNALVANIIHQQIWVNDADGLDTNEGGINSPFKTYDAARSFAAATASPTNRFLINVIGDLTLAGDFNLNPYIDLSFQDSTVTINGPSGIFLDASFTVSNEKVYISGFKPITNVGLNLIFTAGTGNWITFDRPNFSQCDNGFIYNPAPLNDNGISILNDTSPVNCFNTLFWVIQAFSTLKGVNFGGEVRQDIFDDDFDIQARMFNCSAGIINQMRTSGNSIGTLYVRNVKSENGFSVSNGNWQLNIDSDSYNLVAVSNTATYANIITYNTTDGEILGTTTPVNFSFVSGDYPSNALTGYLKGIDNALPKSSGSATLIAGNVTVGSPSVSAGDFIGLMRTAVGGVPGDPTVTITPGVSFTITSDSALDASTFKWKNFGG